MADANRWKRCSACKAAIEFQSTYWVCNVSTCNRKRTALSFCSVSCWEVHLPIANHREAWAEERRAPGRGEAAPDAARRPQTPKREKRRILAPHGDAPRGDARASREAPQEVLIVASRLKDFVRDRSGFNTSDRVLEPLSKIVRRVCEVAIRNAERDGRKTILDRDIPSE